MNDGFILIEVHDLPLLERGRIFLPAAAAAEAPELTRGNDEMDAKIAVMEATAATAVEVEAEPGKGDPC